MRDARCLVRHAGIQAAARLAAIPVAALFAVLVATGAARPAVAEAPAVVVTIKPIHSLVAALMEGIGTPDLLVPGGASPHAYALRPAAARRIERARLIVWGGAGVEPFMSKPLAALGGKAEVITLARLPDLERLAVRAGGAWDEGDEEDEGEDGDEHRHRHARPSASDAESDAGIDMHFWLDVGNARIMAEAVARALARIDPPNAARYRTNRDALRAGLSALDADLRKALAPVRDKPFIVFHDAYQYFEARYGLAAAGSVAVSPERRPSARRLREIRAKIKASGATCVFREPQFAPGVIDAIVEGTGARIGVLDPIGAALGSGPDAYFAMMRGMSESLIGCLGRA